jgi:hypothetical protein
VGEHAVSQLATEFEQARPVRLGRQRRAVANRLPALEENPCQAVEFGPQRFLPAHRKIQVRGDRSGNAELGRTPVLRHARYQESASRTAGSFQTLS